MKITSLRFMRLALAGLIILTVLAACGISSTPRANQPTTDSSVSQPTANVTKPEGLTRADGQGAVTVKVTPLNLDHPTTTLDFEVVLDTHSVDLSMDLTELAVIRLDTGAEVNASAWPVRSGHHVEGTLSFPAKTVEGKSLLDGAVKLTLVLKNVDVPERVFEWDLTN
jgi:hypothetical protein